MFCLRRLGKALAIALLAVAVLASDVGMPRAQDGETAEEVFRDYISGPIIQSKCINCHVEGGAVGEYPAGVRAIIGYGRPRDAQSAELRGLSRRGRG